MRILYVAGSPQSGVIASLAAAFARQGALCETLNIAPHFHPRYRRAPLPLPWPANLRNLALARRQFGDSYRYNFRKTEFAFDFMSRRAAKAIRGRRETTDVVLQAGALFSAAGQSRPHCLYIDHTHAITQRYPPIAGLADPPPISPGWRARERRAYAEADHIFTMSRFVAKSLEDDYGIAASRVTVVGAGPNLPVLPVRAEVPTSRSTILFVGKEHLRKGLPDLLTAFASIRRELPTARLVLVGVPVRIDQEGVENIGPVDAKAMSAHYEEASIFALPTLREPFGLAFLEAMAFGLPCIGTAIEAIPEIIEVGETGFLVPPNDPPALAKHLLALLRDPELAHRLGTAGRRKVETEFTWDLTAMRMLAVLRSLVLGTAGREG